MNTVETVLVVMLAIGFFTLLILSIVLVSVVIAVMKNIKRISERAEEASGNVAELAATLTKRLAPFALSGLAGVAARWFKSRSKK